MLIMEPVQSQVPVAFTHVLVAMLLKNDEKTTVELVFFHHLLHKICSTDARGKSSHFLQTFLTPTLGIHSTNIWEENLLQI